jgi:DNA polymerase III alpha subunit
MTLTLNNRTILDDGTVICDDSAIIQMLYQDINIDDCSVHQTFDVDLYNQTLKFLDQPYTALDIRTSEKYGDMIWENFWLTPDEYYSMDIDTWCLNKCNTDLEKQRVTKELELYRKNNMISMLCHLVFLVDHWRANNVLWGVGRGSSINSFVLFLIGINRINPMTWDLEIEDFLT